MTLTIANVTPSQNKTGAIQRIGFNAGQLPSHFPTNNVNMAGSTIATVTSSQSAPSTGNSAMLQIKEPQTFNKSQRAEMVVKAHAQTESPFVFTNSNVHDDSEKRRVSTTPNTTEYPTQTPFNQNLNAKTDSELTSLVSETATVITITTPHIPIPVDSQGVLNVSGSSNMPAETCNAPESFSSNKIVSSEPTSSGSNPTPGFLVSRPVASLSGLPSTQITDAEMKANTEVTMAVDTNMNQDSCSNYKSDMEIDDELLLQPSRSDTTNSSVNTAPPVLLVENVSVPSSRLNEDQPVPPGLVSIHLPAGATNDITKVDYPSSTETGSQSVAKRASVFQPLADPALRAGVENALRSLVDQTNIDSRLVLRFARELAKAKSQSRGSEGNATGSGEGVQPSEHVQKSGDVTSDNSATSSALSAQYARANDEIAQLRQQLAHITDSYNNAVSSQNQKDALTKRCETLQNELNRSINIHNINNTGGPGALARVNRIQSQLPMKPPMATGSPTSSITSQHALMRRPSVGSSHSISGSVDGTPAVPSQSPMQGVGLTTSISGATVRAGLTPKGSPVPFIPPRSTANQQGHGTGQQGSGVVLTNPAQVQMQYQLQQMMVSRQIQQQVGYTNTATSSIGLLPPAYQQQQTAVHHQMQLLNEQNAGQNYSVGRYEQTLRQQPYFFPGMVPRDTSTDGRSVALPGGQPSQSGQGHMQIQLRKDMPLVPFSESDVHRTQRTPPIMLPQQLPSQPQPQQIHIQTVQSQVYMRGSQPQQHQRNHVSALPPTPTLGPGSPIARTPQTNSVQRQSQEIPLEPNTITTWGHVAPLPPASHPLRIQIPQSYVVSPNQVSAQFHTHPNGALQAPPVAHIQPAPQDIQLNVANTIRTTDASRTVIDLTMDESEGTEIEGPPKKRQRVEETPSQDTVTIFTEADSTLLADEKLAVKDKVESMIAGAEPSVETVVGQVESSTTMITERETEPHLQSHLLIDGFDVLSEEITELLTQVFECSENDTTLRCCFFCMSRHQDDAAEWPEITRLKNPAVEDMVNHLKEIHAPVWEKICRGEYNE
ncbi:hypothetical protein Clacol_001722 [Clathrus columnatus]|uniref:Uncharacterized protein n=1 Tax=Clathrus columnatus TaxID=1419009 RepID=A0AAV5A3D5_9AGAM|nr:hypothetical protein Clacol_001722 [Clathrus columnatus]